MLGAVKLDLLVTVISFRANGMTYTLSSGYPMFNLVFVSDSWSQRYAALAMSDRVSLSPVLYNPCGSITTAPYTGQKCG
jgi:hypothetical protein